MPSIAAQKANNCVSKNGIKFLLYLIASGILALNIVFTFTVNSDDESFGLFDLLVLFYIIFFVSILFFTKIIPIPFYKNTFAFMRHRYGPSLFIIFICKPYFKPVNSHSYS